jgi:hypothetical protein
MSAGPITFWSMMGGIAFVAILATVIFVVLTVFAMKEEPRNGQHHSTSVSGRR